jgi:Cof subfamily protein (haloacid dehalogenase superfamily)
MTLQVTGQAPVFISDLDGTLLQPDARLSEYARASIVKLLEREVLFTIATARSVTSTREILGDLPFRLPVICSNGGSIYSYGDLRPHHVEYIPEHVIREVILDIKERSDTAFVSINDNGAEKVFYDSLPNSGMQWYHDDRVEARDKRLTFVEDIRELISQPVTTVTFMNRFFHIDKTRKFFQKNYSGQVQLNFFENKYSPGWHWLSLHAKKATKANAIRKLVDIAGLEDHPLIVFGDELNDIPMFRNADRAVAVGNALPSVMEIAHEVIGQNSEDAVVNYILEEHNMAQN